MTSCVIIDMDKIEEIKETDNSFVTRVRKMTEAEMNVIKVPGHIKGKTLWIETSAKEILEQRKIRREE